jgi:hypothetical protein
MVTARKFRLGGEGSAPWWNFPDATVTARRFRLGGGGFSGGVRGRAILVP